MRKHNSQLMLTLVLATLLLAACGGGGGGGLAGTGGIGGTGKTSSGSITAFGSIFVNGVEHDIGQANCDINGEAQSGDDCQANLRIGMVVTVTGTVDGSVGTAESVVYDAEVEGAISIGSLLVDPDGLSKTFTVLGTGVRVDRSTTAFDDSPPGFSFETLAEGNVVEVSGFYNATDDLIEATYIELKASAVSLGSVVEIEGVATGVVGGGDGAGDSFMLGSVRVNITALSDLSALSGAVVAEGERVEVHGLYVSDTELDATRIEPEDDALGQNNDNVSLEGYVSGFNGDLSAFFVAGRAVDASGAGVVFVPSSLQLSDGLKIEVEGSIDNGVLLATRVEARSSEIKLDALVDSVVGDSITFGPIGSAGASIVVAVNNQTRMEDDLALSGDRLLLLSELRQGDFLEVRGFLDDAGAFVASEIRRDESDDILVQGPVDVGGIDSAVSVQLLGLRFFVNGLTQYEIDDQPTDAGNFFDTLLEGDTVRVVDDEPADGTANELELEN